MKPYLAPFRVIDLETTDFDLDNFDLIEVSVAQSSGDVQDWQGTHIGVWYSTSEMYRPHALITPKISEITHITPRDVQHLPHLSIEHLVEHPVWEDVFNEDTYLVAHNAQFDRTALEKMLPRIGVETPVWGNRWICTMRLAQHIIGDTDPSISFRLGFLKYYLDLHVPGDISPHRAEYDAHTTAALLDRLIDIGASQSILTLDENLGDQLVTLTHMDPAITRMPFGKYKGQLFAEIPNDYLEWCILKSDFCREDHNKYSPEIAAAIADEMEKRS